MDLNSEDELGSDVEFEKTEDMFLRKLFFETSNYQKKKAKLVCKCNRYLLF